MEPGFTILAKNFRPASQDGELFWNGDAVVPSEEWIADVRAGRRRFGPSLTAMNARGRFESPYLTAHDRAAMKIAEQKTRLGMLIDRPKSLWEEYVRWFISYYSLDADQTQRAWSVYAECSERATQLISRRRDEFAALQSELDQAAANPERAERERLQSRLDALIAPFNEVFERELKPRLDRLPTRAQKKAAEEAPASITTTQPARRTKP